MYAIFVINTGAVLLCHKQCYENMSARPDEYWGAPTSPDDIPPRVKEQWTKGFGIDPERIDTSRGFIEMKCALGLSQVECEEELPVEYDNSELVARLRGAFDVLCGTPGFSPIRDCKPAIDESLQRMEECPRQRTFELNLGDHSESVPPSLKLAIVQAVLRVQPGRFAYYQTVEGRAYIETKLAPKGTLINPGHFAYGQSVYAYEFWCKIRPEETIKLPLKDIIDCVETIEHPSLTIGELYNLLLDAGVGSYSLTHMMSAFDVFYHRHGVLFYRLKHLDDRITVKHTDAVDIRPCLEYGQVLADSKQILIHRHVDDLVHVAECRWKRPGPGWPHWYHFKNVDAMSIEDFILSIQ